MPAMDEQIEKSDIKVGFKPNTFCLYYFILSQIDCPWKYYMHDYNVT